MNEILALFSGGIDKIIDSIGNAIDKSTTSAEEKLKLRNDLENIKTKSKLDMVSQSLEMEKQITKRWEIDSVNVLTRAIRPMTVFWSYFLFTVVLLFDGNIGNFSINESYIPILQTVLVTVTISYFGGRSWDKYNQVKYKKNKDVDLSVF